MTWDDLEYWKSTDWITIQEKLDDLEQKDVRYNPKRECLFRALDDCPFDLVRVAIFGQDPYPNHDLATGLAFSIPKGKKRPPTLENIFKEYVDDLGHSYPLSGDLSIWCSRGVLLWNAIPSCYDGISRSHDWSEWQSLTKEIVQQFSKRPDVILVFLGSVARSFVQYARDPMEFPPLGKPTVLEYSHPSPRGAYSGWSPFRGSRMFSTINSYLAPNEPIDWKLP